MEESFFPLRDVVTLDVTGSLNFLPPSLSPSPCERRYKERSEIEALYFHINTQLKSLNQPAFTPQEGQLIHDLERTWEELERAEHTREVALRQELLRQERLEQLNYKFEKKV